MSEPVSKKDKLIQPAVLIICDLVMLELAFLTTYWFRFYAGIWPVPLGIPPLGFYLTASVVVLLVFFGIFYANGMYGLGVARGIEEELVGLFKGVVLGSLLVLALTFFFRHMTFSRSFFGLFFLSCFFFLTLGRALTHLLLRRILQRGVGTTRLILVGDNPMRERVLRAAHELPGLALQPLGWLRVQESRAAAPVDPVPVPDELADPVTLPCLGSLAEIREVVQRFSVDLVVLTLPFEQLPLVASATSALENLNTDVQLVPDLMALHASRMRLTEVAGIPFISVREGGLSAVDHIVKRSFDLVCAAAGLLLLAPLGVLLALLVKLDSRGPVFYRQERVGHF